ncbi:hypothetical protein [Solidesulfovibrio sp.]|uniref:hypothetical protein n=1 Tax=Solidesulfovibrio sp. TaxID=2910990 RepID=UPI002B208BE3|nr:hypothetical protein [Solidesulfovibrio sp.]MEA4856345.1 hypothetical protein [Solidesulfovibrio sp.]
MPLIPKQHMDVAFQLFSCGMVWDGNLASKTSRDWLVDNKCAVRREGFQAMTGKGVFAFLLTPVTWKCALIMLKKWKRTGFFADDARIKRNLS